MKWRQEVHNSGHWTNEGANINQFQAHIKAVANCELENISIKNHSAMVNILSKKPDLKNIKDFDYAYYDYNKSERHNRKLGTSLSTTKIVISLCRI